MKSKIINVSFNDNLENSTYPIFVGTGILSNCDEILKKFVKDKKVILIHDTFFSSKKGEDKKFFNFVKSIKKFTISVNLISISGGDKTKNIFELNHILEKSLSYEISRDSLIIAFGGGVIGDIAGFASSILLRGINYIQIPTTLLSQVDSSVGGKTGINSSKSKNLIGSFHQPKLVVIDPETLRTLPEREFQAGMAEIIKYAVIGDKLLFELLETATSINNLLGMGIDVVEEIIERSAKAKAKVVIKDEREGGLRAILNYGHTFGHVVENLCGYGRYLHGEAVSIGMVAAGELSVIKGLWTRNDALRQKKLLEKAGLPTNWPKLDYKDVISTLKGDKKVKDGKIRFVLASNIGKVEISDNINENDIINCLENLTK